MLNLKALIFNLCLLLIFTQDKHKIDDLFDGIYDGEIYSGYLKTDVEGNELFYIFTPSQSDPANDPFFLWLNGGPGCSSLSGFLKEIGPVIYNGTQKRFIKNEYSWNNKANLLFIESPVTVGFTKFVNLSFYFNDTIQAVSLNIGLRSFFSLFSEYQNNDFYITGESYAGVYIPHLVQQIFKYNEENPNEIKIEPKGILIGNPYTMEIMDFEDSMVEFGFAHALIGYRTFKGYLEECPHIPQKEMFLEAYKEPENYEYAPTIMEGNLMPWKLVTHECNEIRKKIQSQYNGINFYGIYRECLTAAANDEMNSNYKNIDYKESLKDTFEYSFLKNLRQKNYNEYYQNNQNNLKISLNNDINSNKTLEEAIDFFPGCGKDLFTIDWLNDPNTKEKLGVSQNITYKQCYSKINYKWGESIDFYINDLPKLSKNGFKAWLFSGAEDIAVATLGTLRMINYLNYTIEDEWKAWKVDGQIAGFEQAYNNGLKFLTVKGIGHMVPEENPRVAKEIFDKFLYSKK